MAAMVNVRLPNATMKARTITIVTHHRERALIQAQMEEFAHAQRGIRPGH